MRRIKTYSIHRFVSLLLLTVFAASALTVLPVSALSGDPETETTVKAEDSNEGSSTQVVEKKSSSRTTVKTATTDDDNANVDDIREKASALISEQRKGRKEHTTEARKKACEARSANLNKRIENYNRSASKHLETFNKIFDRVQAFQTEKKLDAADYDALVAAANAKKATATAAVEALGSVSVEVDCTASDPATAVATVKTAVKTARDALKEYRTAIKNVVSALSAAKVTASTESETN